MLVNNSNDNQFIVPFVGLKVGMHEFEFDLTNTFFEENEYSLIQKGKVLVKLLFEKKETMMIGNYSVSGSVILSCNRCNDDLKVEIDGDYRLVYKFDSSATNDESLVIVYPEEFELDVKKTILELINVSLPVRAVHNEGDCNEEMLDFLDEYVVNTQEYFEDESADELDEDNVDEIDPRWNALKNLKK